ncbi:MAG: heavy metal translocating P-type ATPase [Nitrososphaerales archaeon]
MKYVDDSLKNEYEENEEKESVEEGEEERGKRFWITLAGILFLVVGLFLAWLRIGKGLEDVLYGGALAIATAPVFWEALKRLRKNPFNADLLMSIAAAGAAAIGVWEEGAAVLILYNIAETIEDYTVERVRKIVVKMAALLPKRALVKRNGKLEEVPVDKLRVGEVIIVKPGWRIPIDGKIISGYSNIDQSAITGESIPIEKAPGDEVLSGTLNVEGSLEIQVQKPFKESTISRIVKLVMEARERKTNIERFVDKFSRRYTPTMIIVATLIALIPPLLLGGSFSVWVYRALIALIIACPSAFVIATPVTVLMGLTRAMWSGVLIKGGIYLEEASRIRVVAFDKTGTLTLGKLKVSEIFPSNDFQKRDVLRLAALAESRSSHPIGLAIVKAAEEQGLKLDEYVKMMEVAGKGIKASLGKNNTILVGKPSFLQENGVKVDEAIIEGKVKSGGTLVAISADGKYAGSIVIADELRPEAKEAVKTIMALGVESVEILTGDNEVAVKTIAEQLSITKYHAALLPEDKVRLVKVFREKYGSVAMVGDGVNDAPVLAASNVGIAIGTAGNDIAIEAADIALMGSDLRSVPYTIKLGRKVVNKLKINIALTLSFKFFMIALGALGLIPLWFAVIGDDGVTLILISNALPLLRFRK